MNFEVNPSLPIVAIFGLSFFIMGRVEIPAEGNLAAGGIEIYLVPRKH
jgi:hypothetical protein